MKVKLFDFQEDALANLHGKIQVARSVSSIDNPQVISFSAPTGSGKTVIMTALFEDIFFGEPGFDKQSDAVILWLSDMPELNKQTRQKIESMSDRIRVRQLIDIETNFVAEKLEGGHIYFVNTQKLGTDKLLTSQGDKRQYTIWETLTNTAKAMPDRFYVVIDEAHRGMGNGRATAIAQTIVQRFLLGSAEHGLCQMPLIIGISATPQRFEKLLLGTNHTVHKVHINPEDVRESGLLKDRIIIHYPESSTQAEMTILAEAANYWQFVKTRWAEYCQKDGDLVVSPILVVQVEDGTRDVLTKTDLSTCLAMIEKTIGRKLLEGEVVHTFNDDRDIYVNGYRIRYIEASQIEEDNNVGIVLFKMNLSTGWDCPRAEVMMSFRPAQDHTYIAQLVGRMVRTPLARRIESDATLNDVHLFLPHYDQEAVELVIQDLKDTENAPPATTGTSRELITLYRRNGLDDVFGALGKLVTYRLNAVRKQSSLRRLMGLGRALTYDRIDEDALERVKGQIVGKMTEEIQRLRNDGLLEEQAQRITGINLKTVAVEHGTGTASDINKYSIETVPIDIDHYFEQAGRLLGNGLHMEYWRAQKADRKAEEVKIEVIVLAQDYTGMKNLEDFAEGEFNRLYEKHKWDIVEQKEQRRKAYERLRLAASVPQDIPWILPDSIDFYYSPNAPEYDKHLYVESDGKFRADLDSWEKEILEIELQKENVVGWLRNIERKPWALQIPYRYGGDIKPMYPDFIVVRKDEKGFRIDILEPHRPDLKDNVPKAIGLAEFAERHWTLFDRIQLIRKQRGADGIERYFRLDVCKDSIRKRVLAITNDSQLDQLFKTGAIV